MRIGLVFERKTDFQSPAPELPGLDSEFLSPVEEAAVIAGLRGAGHEVVPIGDALALLGRISFCKSNCDLVLNLSVGYHGVERKLHAAAVLELAGIDYIGSTPYVHALTRHKYHAKLVAADAGLHTPKAVMLEDPSDGPSGSMTFPAIVKPLAESSSIGIDEGCSVVENRDAALAQAKALVRRHRQPALIESFIVGAEVEVPVIIDPEPRAAGVVAITVGDVVVEGNRLLTADIVYGDKYGFSAPPSYVDLQLVESAAIRAAKALGLRDYGRIDFRVDESGTPWFIEASTHPHLLPHSSLFWLAQRRGLTYAGFLDEIVRTGALRIARR